MVVRMPVHRRILHLAIQSLRPRGIHVRRRYSKDTRRRLRTYLGYSRTGLAYLQDILRRWVNHVRARSLK